MNYLGRFRDWLNRPRLIIGEHDRDQRRRARAKPFLQMLEVEHALLSDASNFDPRVRKPPAGQHGGMFDRRHDQPFDGRTSVTPEAWRQRQRIGFGPTRGEDDISRQRSNRARDCGSRTLDPFARLPSLSVDRGGIARQLQRINHRSPRFVAKWRRRIPVEINAVGHA